MKKFYSLALAAVLLGTTSFAETKEDTSHLKKKLNNSNFLTIPPPEEDQKICNDLCIDVTECSRTSAASSDPEKAYKDCVFKVTTLFNDRNHQQSWTDLTSRLKTVVKTGQCLFCHADGIYGGNTPRTWDTIRKAMARMKATLNDKAHKEAFENVAASVKGKVSTPENLPAQLAAGFLKDVNEFDKAKAK